ncbi:MAG: hypothetical protein ACPGO3_08005 [Magnetospiraceae bacterium]
MTVSIRVLTGREELPALFSAEGTLETPEQPGETLAAFMTRIGLDAITDLSTLVNGKPVAPEDRAARVLVAGDEITAFPAMEGG